MLILLGCLFSHLFAALIPEKILICGIAKDVDTILHPEHKEWGAVLANGAYDLFAFRDPEFPIGLELIGTQYWSSLDQIRKRLSLNPQDPWKKVYSAFGGLGIYKRKAIQGCRYSGVVTKDVEKVITTWLEKARQTQKKICFLEEYEKLLAQLPIIDLRKERLSPREQYPPELGIRLYNEHGMGNIVWFSCNKKKTLPWTCEHVTFHAAMTLRGHDKIFINPHLTSIHPSASKE